MNKASRGSASIALVVITTAQLMLVLDDSIVNIALPSIQRSLDVEPVDLPWVVNAYIVVFGSLLLVGGRIGDVWGRRRTFSTGIAIFVAGSLAGGMGHDLEVLVAARALQGLGAALAAPNALALIATSFQDNMMRDRALSLYGAMSELGIIAGLFLGGVLTEVGGWRWVFFINVPIGLLVLWGSRSLTATRPASGPLGGIGAALVTGGMLTMTYGITRMGEHGLFDLDGLILIVGAAILLGLFVLSQAKDHRPLLPLALLADRSRAGAYLGMLLLAIGPMGTFYIITLYLQDVRHFTPVEAGTAWLPFAVGIMGGAALAPVLIARTSARVVAPAGALLSAVATAWFSRIGEDASYWAHLAPAMFVLALGFGFGVMALTQAAVYDVSEDRAGVAAAVLNAAQQVGVGLGLALLAGVAAAVTGESSHGAAAVVDGYQRALDVATGILLTAAVITAALIRGTGGPARPDPVATGSSWPGDLETENTRKR